MPPRVAAAGARHPEMTMSTNRLHTVNGNDKRGGVIPDVEVPVDRATRILIDRAISRLEVPRQYREQVLAQGLELPSPPSPADDPQLKAALEQF